MTVRPRSARLSPIIVPATQPVRQRASPVLALAPATQPVGKRASTVHAVASSQPEPTKRGPGRSKKVAFETESTVAPKKRGRPRIAGPCLVDDELRKSFH